MGLICKRIYAVRFPIDFGRLHIYSNDENTRTFVGLQVQLGYNHLAECVDCVNQSFTEFRLPTYYEVF